MNDTTNQVTAPERPERIELPKGYRFEEIKSHRGLFHLVQPDGQTIKSNRWWVDEAQTFATAIATLEQQSDTSGAQFAKYVEALTIRPMSEAPKGPTIMAIFHGDQCPVRWNGNSWVDQDGEAGWQDRHFQGFFDLRKLDGLLIVPANLKESVG